MNILKRIRILIFPFQYNSFTTSKSLEDIEHDLRLKENVFFGKNKNSFELDIRDSGSWADASDFIINGWIKRKNNKVRLLCRPSINRLFMVIIFEGQWLWFWSFGGNSDNFWVFFLIFFIMYLIFNRKYPNWFEDTEEKVRRNILDNKCRHRHAEQFIESNKPRYHFSKDYDCTNCGIKISKSEYESLIFEYRKGSPNPHIPVY
jgi:hypothetical protein